MRTTSRIPPRFSHRSHNLLWTMAEVVVGDHQETPAEYDDRVAFPPVLIPGLTIRMYGVAVDKENEPVLDEGEVPSG